MLNRSVLVVVIVGVWSCTLPTPTPQAPVEAVRVDATIPTDAVEATFEQYLTTGQIFAANLAPNVTRGLKDFHAKKKLANGKVYGQAAANLRISSQPMETTERELVRAGFKRESSFLRDPATLDFIKDSTGAKIPILLFAHPDGSIVRIKPQGDVTSKFVTWPVITVSFRYPFDASPNEFASEVVKFDNRGRLLPKGPWEVNAPYPTGSAERDYFITLWSESSHQRLHHTVGVEQVLANGKLSLPLRRLLRVFDPNVRTQLAPALELTHREWSLPKGKERWKVTDRHESLRPTALPLLRDLGILRPFYPSRVDYEGAVVLGALTPRVRLRLHFLVSEWQRGVRFKQLVFLVGNRKLDPSLEGQDVMWNHNNDEYPFPKNATLNEEAMPTTETEMAKLVYQQAPMPEEMRSVPVLFVDTPVPENKDQTRPNTENTAQTWLDRYKPVPGNYLVVSNNPYLGYQHAVLRSVLPPEIAIETVGPEDSGTGKFIVYLDTIVRWLDYEQRMLGQTH